MSESDKVSIVEPKQLFSNIMFIFEDAGILHKDEAPDIIPVLETATTY